MYLLAIACSTNDREVEVRGSSLAGRRR